MESHSPNSIAATTQIFSATHLLRHLIVLPLIFSATNYGSARRRPHQHRLHPNLVLCHRLPHTRYSSLSSHAALIQQNHKVVLSNIALSVSLDTTRSTSAAVLKLSHTSSTMHDCLEVLGDSVDQFKKSLMVEMNQLNGSNFEMSTMSAALTDEDTCMDGFAGKDAHGGGSSQDCECGAYD